MIENLKKFLKENKKKYLIFDFDETIVNLHFDLDPLRDMMRKEIKKFAPELIKKYPSGSTFKLHFEAIASYGSYARKIILDIADKYEQQYDRNVTVNEELCSFIKSNVDEYRMYIWSINTQRTIQKYLQRIKLKKCFDRIIARDDVDFIKYFPDGFYLLFDPRSQKRGDYLLIGDSDKSDKGAAENCGIDFFKVDPLKITWKKVAV